MGYSFRAGETIFGIDRRIVRFLGIMTVLAAPAMIAMVLFSMTSEADTPDDGASKFVFESYTDIITSPLDYFIVGLMFAMTLLVGFLFFLNKKHHYVIMLALLGIMAVINFFVILTAVQGGLVIAPFETFLAIFILAFGFGLLPTLFAFILGGLAVITLSFRNAKLKQNSFAQDFQSQFAQIGLKIWRPKIFGFSIFLAITLLIVSAAFPQIEGNPQTSAVFSFILFVVLFWCFLLIMMQLTFNLMQGVIRPGFFAFKHNQPRTVRKKKQQSNKQSIRNIRKRRN